MASNNDETSNEAMQAAPAGDDIAVTAAAGTDAKPARKRAVRSASSRAEAAKKAAATRARNKAAAAALAAEQAKAAETAPAPAEPGDAPKAAAEDEIPVDFVIAPTEDPFADPSTDPVVIAAQAAEAIAAEKADEDAAGPAVPTFGLLFQAPTVQPDVPAVPTEDEPDDADTDETDADEEAEEREESNRSGRRSRGRGRGRGRRSADADDSDDNTSEQEAGGASAEDTSAEDGDSDTAGDDDDSEDSDDSGESGRRRRRRGGRGRRRTGRSDSSDSDDSSSQDESDDSDDDDSDDSSDDGEQSSGTGRRRRRRRRGSSGGDSDDPPGTVTKVREPRETATGIKGSTRLEAKRQRRREGREAGRRRTIITEAEFLARRESVERVMVVRDRGAHTQIGVLEDGVLVEHYISGGGTAAGAAGAPGASMAGNVYLGRVQNVLPSMEAAFVDIGKGRNAVLYAGEVNWDAAGLEQHKARRIENALSSGQSVLVQVTKDPIGHKGARLTSQVSLPGRYLVYVPDGSMTGISRKLPDTERTRLKKILKQIVPDDAGVIVRTAAEGASEAELTADVERLRRVWEKIQKKAKTGNAPVLLHGEPDLTTRVVRDVFNEDFKKLVVSGDRAWESISEYVDSVAPDLADRVTKWTGEKDVFAEHRIDEQLAKAMDRKVWLPSGGSLVIDRTEAMTVIDVNTGKFTGSGGNLEETVTKNNIEAAEEIVRQLRLRDIGGIIVVDFIDMVLESNRELVVRRLVECLGRDRTKHQVAEVTSLGLVQMTRKRVGAGLIEVFSEPCEHCSGRGVLIHSEPLDKSGGGNESSGEGRGRRGGKRAKGGNGNGRSERQETPAPPTPTGPTPAQIAAAAYAAAVQSHESDDDEVDEADVTAGLEAVESAVEALVEERAEDVEVPVPTSADEDEDLPEPTRPRVTGRAGGLVVAVTDPDTDAAEPVEPIEPVSLREPVPTADPVVEAAPKRRRAGRRAASAPVAAPSGTTVGVFTADEPEAPKQPLTVSAAEAAAGSGEAPSAPPAEEPAAPKRRRAARRAAGSPAGPPAGAVQN